MPVPSRIFIILHPERIASSGGGRCGVRQPSNDVPFDRRLQHRRWVTGCRATPFSALHWAGSMAGNLSTSGVVRGRRGQPLGRRTQWDSGFQLTRAQAGHCRCLHQRPRGVLHTLRCQRPSLPRGLRFANQRVTVSPSIQSSIGSYLPTILRRRGGSRRLRVARRCGGRVTGRGGSRAASSNLNLRGSRSTAIKLVAFQYGSRLQRRLNSCTPSEPGRMLPPSPPSPRLLYRIGGAAGAADPREDLARVTSLLLRALPARPARGVVREGRTRVIH